MRKPVPESKEIDICKICSKAVMVTDEYIRLADCLHVFHRICLIHRQAQKTDKKIFLSKQEIEEDPSFHICETCEREDQSKTFGRYREHIIFDLLKENG